MTKLNELKPNAGSTKNRTRVGRGIGSGKGKTCGSGQKGQKSRSGVAINGFEGGQMPLYMRMPKSGFNNKKFATKLTELTLGRLQEAIDAKLIDAKKAIDEDALVKAGVSQKQQRQHKLLLKKQAARSISSFAKWLLLFAKNNTNEAQIDATNPPLLAGFSYV